MIVKSAFAEALRRERKLYNVTQAQLASKMHLSKRTIEYWESGTRAPRESVQYEALAAIRLIRRPAPPKKKALKPSRIPKIGGVAHE
jgi:transcriptional regulator with XRE-family HTH domain